MKTTDPTDIAPLSYGCGLTLGLLLILGLPRQVEDLTRTATPARAGSPRLVPVHPALPVSAANCRLH